MTRLLALGFYKPQKESGNGVRNKQGCTHHGHVMLQKQPLVLVEELSPFDFKRNSTFQLGGPRTTSAKTSSSLHYSYSAYAKSVPIKNIQDNRFLLVLMFEKTQNTQLNIQLKLNLLSQSLQGLCDPLCDKMHFIITV